MDKKDIKKWLDKLIGKPLRKLLFDIVDQILHFLWAFFALLPIVLYGPKWWIGALSGLLIALPRELIDQWPINNWEDTIIDLCFFMLGGAVVTLIF